MTTKIMLLVDSISFETKAGFISISTVVLSIALLSGMTVGSCGKVGVVLLQLSGAS